MSTKEGTTSASTSTAASGRSCTSITALPAEVLESVLIYTVQTPRDLAACALTCKAFSQAASCPTLLWRVRAVHRYGLEVAEASETLYDSNWKALVADDNRKGALPTLLDHKPCNYRWNRAHQFYCCLIVAIKWNRLMGEIRIYLDARGETDLRPPDGSSVRMENEDEGVESQMTVQGQWVSELSQEESRPGHYKGYLAFPHFAFMSPGIYKFCYANFFHGMADYQSITIMNVPSTGGLADAFIMSDRVSTAERQARLTYAFIMGGRVSTAERQARLTYSTNASPFDKDAPEIGREIPEIEHDRWKKWVSKAVLERHTMRRLFGGERQQQWWV
jgi:hypothetical protein